MALILAGLLTASASGEDPGYSSLNTEMANPAWATRKRSYTWETFTYKTVGDTQIRLTAFRTPGQEDERPALFYIHGGAFILGGRMDIVSGYVEKFLSSGFVVISVDYRLAPETKLDGIIEDLTDAYRWMRNEGSRLCKIDPDRIAVLGESAGGYLALAAGHRFKPHPKAVGSFYGFGDLTGDWCNRSGPNTTTNSPVISKEQAYQAINKGVPTGTSYEDSARDAFSRYCAQQGIWIKEVTGHNSRTEPELFAPLCPIKNVAKDYPPTILLHGDRDEGVPYKESVNMYETLKRHGVTCELLTATNGVHGFDWFNGGLKNATNALMVDRLADFLKLHTQPVAKR